MKKNLALLLILSLFFSNCKKDSNSPDSNPPSSNFVCGNLTGTVNGVTLNYSPLAHPDCFQGNSYTTSILNTVVLNFYSECSNGGPDFNLTISVSASSIQINVPYSFNVTSSIITTIMYEAKNCGSSAPLYMNQNGATYNGTFTFTQIDTTSKLISGSCTGVTLYATGHPSIQLDCIFSNVPYN